MTKTIACAGGLTLDWLATDRGRLGPFPAGNALYSAVGAWLAGSNPVIVARVGRDYPAAALEEVAAMGLSTSQVRRVEGNSYRVLLTNRPGGRDVRYLKDSGHNATLDVSPSELPREAIAGLHVGPAKSPEQAAILRAGRERGCRTSLDLLFVEDEMQPTCEEIVTLLPLTDAFLPGLSEIRRLWPKLSHVDRLRKVHEAGCGTAVIKMGAEGSIGSDGVRMIYLPAIKTRPVDATGAGDAFCGAFLVQWIETGDLAAAMSWGAAAASVIIENYGVLHAISDRARATVARRSIEALFRSTCDRASCFDRIRP